MADSCEDIGHYPPQEIMQAALELVGLKAGLDLLGKRFIFSYKQGSDSIILLGTITGVQLFEDTTPELLVSVPFFRNSKLRSFVHFKKKEWMVKLLTRNQQYKGILEILE